MKLSEHIQVFQEAMKQHGDVDVFTRTTDGRFHWVGPSNPVSYTHLTLPTM
jgi:hypothetical protein